MMRKYPREAIVAAIQALTTDEFRPIDALLAEDGVDPFMQIAAIEVGGDIARTVSDDPRAQTDDELVALAAEVALLHGVRLGLKLAEGEARLDAAMDVMRRDGSLKVKHYRTQEDAARDGLEFHAFEKVGSTRLARVDGHFSCETIDGNTAHCEDGWLAVDCEGHLYPVADEVARASYALPAS